MLKYCFLILTRTGGQGRNLRRIEGRRLEGPRRNSLNTLQGSLLLRSTWRQLCYIGPYLKHKVRDTSSEKAMKTSGSPEVGRGGVVPDFHP